MSAAKGGATVDGGGQGADVSHCVATAAAAGRGSDSDGNVRRRGQGGRW